MAPLDPPPLRKYATVLSAKRNTGVIENGRSFFFCLPVQTTSYSTTTSPRDIDTGFTRRPRANNYEFVEPNVLTGTQSEIRQRVADNYTVISRVFYKPCTGHTDTKSNIKSPPVRRSGT